MLAPALLLAQNPFEGTWKTRLDQTKFSPKPITFSVSNGIYDNPDRVPPTHVKADGEDHSVGGTTEETIAVREVNAHTIQVVSKKEGRTVQEEVRTVSEDGKTLTITLKPIQQQPGSNPPAGPGFTLERVGKAPPGAHAISGSWRMQKASVPEADLLDTFKANGDELAYSTPGVTWTAKPDGKDYPVKGGGYDTVSLKQVDDHKLELNYKRESKSITVIKLTIAPDGKRMTAVVEDKRAGSIATSVADKQ